MSESDREQAPSASSSSSSRPDAPARVEELEARVRELEETVRSQTSEINNLKRQWRAFENAPGRAELTKKENTDVEKEQYVFELKRQKRALENAAGRAEPAKKAKTDAQKKRLFVKWLKRQKRALENAPGRAEPAKKAKTDAQKKRLFVKWVKALRAQAKKTKTSNYGSGEWVNLKVKESAPLSPDHFADLFMEKGGTKTQPLPNNKPSSQITIVAFDTYEKVATLFGGQEVIPANGYKLTVRKHQMNWGKWDSWVKHLDVEYHMKNHQLTLKFTVEKDEQGYFTE